MLTPCLCHLLLLLLLLFTLLDASACSYTAATKQVSCNLGSVAPGAPAKVVWIVVNVVASPASHTYALSGTTASNGPVTQAPKPCTVPVVSLCACSTAAGAAPVAALHTGQRPCAAYMSKQPLHA
jgi:hypothetical protein